MSSDHEAQKDEMLALESIFDTDEFLKYENRTECGGQFKAFVTLPDDFKVVYRDLRIKKTENGLDNTIKDHVNLNEVKLKFLPPLELSFTLPSNYPSSAPPNFTLSCQWLDRIQLTKLCQKLDDMWKENEGLEILYLWMSFLKEDSYSCLGLGPSLDLSKQYTSNLDHIEKMKYRLEQAKAKALFASVSTVKNKPDKASAQVPAEPLAGPSGLKTSDRSQTSTDRVDAEGSQHRGAWGRGRGRGRWRGRGRGRYIAEDVYKAPDIKPGASRVRNSSYDSFKENHTGNGSIKDANSTCQSKAGSEVVKESDLTNKEENMSVPLQTIRQENSAHLNSQENQETGFAQPSKSTSNLVETVQNVNKERVIFTDESLENLSIENTSNSKQRKTSQEDILDMRAVSVTNSQEMFIDFLKEYNGKCLHKEFQRNIFTCKICFDEKHGAQCIEFFGCGHVFCRECVAGYFSVRITDGNVQSMTCLEDGCKSEALQAQVRDLVCPSLFAKYDSLLLASTLDMMDDIVYCPRKSCQYPVSRDAEETMGRCPQCRYTFCVVCKMTYHGVEPCRMKLENKQELIAEYEGASEERKAQLERRYGRKLLQDLVDLTKSEAWLSDNSKNCPHCQAAIEKSDGCNKMICWKCKTIFCWICSECLDQRFPYLHFNSPTSKCFKMLFHGVPDDEDFDEADFVDGDGEDVDSEEEDGELHYYYYVEEPILAEVN